MATAARSQASPDGLVLPEAVLPGLAEALSTAERNAPRLLIAADDVRQADEQLWYYTSQYLPRAGGFASYAKAKESRSDGTSTDSNKLYYYASASQPLYHWGAIRASVQLGKLGYEGAKLRAVEASRAIATEIRNAYLGLISKKLALRNARFEAQRAETALHVTSERVKQNLAPSGDEYSRRIARDDRVLAADRAELDYRHSLQAFARLIGAPAFTDEQVPSSVPKLPDATLDNDATEAWASSAPHRSPSVRANEVELEKERLNYKIVSTNLLPKFNLTAGATQDQTSSFAGAPRVNTTWIGVGFNWNIFDSFATRSQKRASRTRQRMLERMVERVSADTKAAAQRAAEELKLAVRGLALAELRWRDSKGIVEFTQGDIDKGILPADAVEEARGGLYGAELGIAQARASYLMACAQFLSLVGADPVAERLLTISSR